MKVNVLTINSKASLVAIALLSVSFFAAAAQTPITVTTDKTSYTDGDTIAVSGTVTDQLGIPISIVVRDSSHNMVYIAQASPGSDGTYSAQVVAGGNTWKTSGTYEIDVTYGGPDKTAKTTFGFTLGASQPTPIENQTNITSAIPEFGPLSAPILAIAVLTSIVLYSRVKPSFRI